MPTFKQKIKRLPVIRQAYFNLQSCRYPHMKKLKEIGIQSGDVVLDFGANVGDISQIMLDMGAEVHAYEPNPFAFKELKDRFKKTKRFYAHPAAVGTKSEVAELFFHESHTEDEVLYSQASSLYAKKGNLSQNDPIQVDVEDAAKIIEKFQNIKLIKIDIEGLEYDLLEHIIPLADKYEKILCETHNVSYPELQEKHDKIVSLIKENNLENKIDLDWV